MASKFNFGGRTTLETHDSIPHIALAWRAVMASAANAGAEKAMDEAMRIFEDETNWKPNRPSTVKRKGHSKVMLGPHAMLVDGLAIEKWVDSIVEQSHTLGWEDTPRPDSNLNLAQLAEVMEGIRPPPDNWPQRMGRFANAPYPWLSQIAHGSPAWRVLKAMWQVMLAEILAINATLAPARRPSGYGGAKLTPVARRKMERKAFRSGGIR